MELLYGTKKSCTQGEARVQEESMKHDSDPEDESQAVTAAIQTKDKCGKRSFAKNSIKKRLLRRDT